MSIVLWVKLKTKIVIPDPRRFASQSEAAGDSGSNKNKVPSIFRSNQKYNLSFRCIPTIIGVDFYLEHSMERKNNIRFLLLFLVLPVLLSSCATPRVARAPVSAGYDLVTLPPTPMIREAVYHSVAPGETLWRIAKMYEVDISTIQQANNIRNVKDIDIGTRLYIPEASPRRHVITLYPNRKWKYIVIHHSATEVGNSLAFNAAHLRKGWQGVGYQFIIDNGTAGKDDGQIETSPRWIKQTDGAHCKANGMNTCGIGICLVGNFSKDSVSRKQMDSLVLLVNKLRKYYKIPKRNILGHGQVPGARTECPGTRFPWKTFRARLGRG